MGFVVVVVVSICEARLISLAVSYCSKKKVDIYIYIYHS